MGIVVCVTMLAGLLVIWPRTSSRDWIKPLHRIAPWLLIIVGGWNVFWYGLQNMPQFWGIAALVSGAFMILSGLLLLPQDGAVARLQTPLRGFKPIIVLGLALSFLLYAVTLVQLNLGMPILG